jgi:hypothetical protein
VVAAAVVLALAAGASAQIALELRFDGQPFDPKAPPEFTCLSAALGRWVGCRVEKADGPGAYVLTRPAPGKYRIHVSIDGSPGRTGRRGSAGGPSRSLVRPSRATAILCEPTT